MLTHPAKFSPPILEAIEGALAVRLSGDALLLDPFAGIGGVHQLPWRTVGVELEAEWAAQHPDTLCGDSTDLGALGIAPGSFDAVVTSPAYGNRMADSYAGDPKGTRRFTYRIALGRPLSDNSGAGLQWGDEYRRLHQAVWVECREALKPDGWMLVNVSNHIRKGVEQPVVEWHLSFLFELGFLLDEVIAVPTQRMRFGANSESRAATEKVLVLRRK
jgi:hypothetical protein